MAMLRMEDFKRLSTATLTYFYDAVVFGADRTEIVTEGANKVCKIDDGDYLRFDLPFEIQTFTAGMYVKFAVASSTDFFFGTYNTAGTLGLNIRQTSGGALEVLRATTSLGTSGPGVVTPGVYHRIEFQATKHASTGMAKVIVDGITVINLTNVNTSNAQWQRAQFHGPGVANQYTYVDWFYIDGNASVVTPVSHGNVLVGTLLPDADGSTQEWTVPGGGNAWQKLDDDPLAVTDWLESTTDTNLALIGHAAVPAGAIIKAMQSSIVQDKDDAGEMSLKLVCKSGATTDVSSTAIVPILNTPKGAVRCYDNDPNTAAAWTETNANAAEFGFRRDAP